MRPQRSRMSCVVVIHPNLQPISSGSSILTGAVPCSPLRPPRQPLSVCMYRMYRLVVPYGRVGRRCMHAFMHACTGSASCVLRRFKRDMHVSLISISVRAAEHTVTCRPETLGSLSPDTSALCLWLGANPQPTARHRTTHTACTRFRVSLFGARLLFG